MTQPKPPPATDLDATYRRLVRWTYEELLDQLIAPMGIPVNSNKEIGWHLNNGLIKLFAPDSDYMPWTDKEIQMSGWTYDEIVAETHKRYDGKGQYD